MEQQTFTIDSQVHAYERNIPARPWLGFLHGPKEVTGDDMVGAMDQLGVDGALLVSPFSLYGYDASYALQVYDKYPGRFGLIKPFDPRSESIAEDLTTWSGIPGVVGARIMLTDQVFGSDDLGLNRILSIGGRAGIPINVMCSGNLSLFRELAIRHPNTQLVVDHLGLTQPYVPPVPLDPFSDLDNVIELADYDNVAIKISGACTLSHESFPYDDIWAPLTEIFEAFGLRRCMWGTDWTRAVGLLSYKNAVEAFRTTGYISDSDRSQLMGGSLANIYNWSPDSV